MAIVVLLNLNAMFVEEKKRELIVLMINGFSVKDAQRYVSNDSIVLTVGRDLQTVTGADVEIQDYVYHTSVWDVPSALLACALLLLTQEKEEI